MGTKGSDRVSDGHGKGRRHCDPSERVTGGILDSVTREFLISK